jgi:large subunit ribosomal protein L18
MIEKKQARLRRARKTRAKIAELKAVRLSVHRSNCHIYAQVISACGSGCWRRLLRSSRKCARCFPMAATSSAAKTIGLLIAERAKQAGIEQVSFDRAGLQYHGRIKALADAAREAGLKF